MAALLGNIIGGLEMLIEDSTVPRNVRQAAESAKALLVSDAEPLDVRKAKAISTLDEMANDPNLPMYGRTVLYQVMGQLEGLQ